MSTTVTTKGPDRVYEYEDIGLDENEALDRYTQEKAQNPAAIVNIEGLDCGFHYTVRVYRTESEKRTFYQKTIRKMFENLWDAVKT